MPLDLGDNQRSVSPVSSGRSSPVNRPPRRPAGIEDGLHKKDKAFRRYASGVERALSLLDTVQQEWADYISFLGRLLKAIQSHPPGIRSIPHDVAVATRLAQCLNPSLPSGVHQKALEVYAYIFAAIGDEALAQNLHLYFPGLSSVLSFASLTVRPAFLSLIESHVVTLGASAIRPALKAIILCLLPGLEDETSEDFERVFHILDAIKSAVKEQTAQERDTDDGSGDVYFWQCFFLASITNSSRRQGALAFLSRELPKFGANQQSRPSIAIDEGAQIKTFSSAAQAAVSPEPGLLIRCFVAGLSDRQLLIQRGFLDLLVTHLPLDSPALQTIASVEDLDRLVAAAAGVVARRDMGLNRRLWAWFLGPGTKSAATQDGHGQPESPSQELKSPLADVIADQAAYFMRYGSRPLTRSTLSLLRQAIRSPTDAAKPYRICLSLMDRWEVGGSLIPAVFLPAMDRMYRYSSSASKDHVDEVLRSASIFFDGVESGLIWGKLLELILTALGEGSLTESERLHKLDLIRFIITRFNIREEEMLTCHVPLTTLALLTALRDNMRRRTAEDDCSQSYIRTTYNIAEVLTQSIPQRAFRAKSGRYILPPPQDSDRTTVQKDTVIASIKAFYFDSHDKPENIMMPFSPSIMEEHLLLASAALFTDTLRSDLRSGNIDVCTRLFSTLMTLAPDPEMLHRIDLSTSLEYVLSPSSGQPVSFVVASALTNLLVVMQHATSSSRPYIDPSQLPKLLYALAKAMWRFLSPFTPKHHVEAVRCLWQLESIDPSGRWIEAAVTSFLAPGNDRLETGSSDQLLESARRFTVLWTHTVQDKAVATEKDGRLVLRRQSSVGIPITQSKAITSHQDPLSRPLLLLLDALGEDGTELCAFVKTWLQDLPSLAKVFHVLLAQICKSDLFRPVQLITGERSDTITQQCDRLEIDARETLYFLQHISRILDEASDTTWVTLAGEVGLVVDVVPATPTRELTLQVLLVEVCMRAIRTSGPVLENQHDALRSALKRTALAIIYQILVNPYSTQLKNLQLDIPLLETLHSSLPRMPPALQTAFLDTILAALRLRDSNDITPPVPRTHRRQSSKGITASTWQPSTTTDPSLKERTSASSSAPPPQLVACLIGGFSSASSRLILDSWVGFLVEVLPLFVDTIFRNLLPLVECFCSQIGQTFEQLKLTFWDPSKDDCIAPEPTLISLMNGLEQILAKAHERLASEETKDTSIKSPEQPQGFFGNMVSGVFTSDTLHSRPAIANSRLTVLLCFQDTVRTCFSIWSWGAYASEDEQLDPMSASTFSYTLLRMRNRARRLLEHLFAAEALECLETLALIWCRAPSSNSNSQEPPVMSLLNVLNGSRPKYTIPAIFNAIHSRTNPGALEQPSRASSMTSDLTDVDLVSFLVEYTKSIEDDAVDEIWQDCMAFIRDVLANPLPHRQILPLLLEFTTVLAEKAGNTNFGEQRKIRKELGDILMRLLTAAFTTRPLGLLPDVSRSNENVSKASHDGSTNRKGTNVDIVMILASMIPKLQLGLVENDRVIAAVASISANITGPAIRAKTFPEGTPRSILVLLYQLTLIGYAAKSWRKDVVDAFNDPKFFNTPLPLVKECWVSILLQWTMHDKDRLPELLSRLSSPTTAGIMFGVGAVSARLEADRKTQLNLRRIALLILASANDTFVPNLGIMEEKVSELLSATPASSPSSATRPEVFMLLRALVLKVDSVHLAPLWPILDAELQNVIASVLPDSDQHDKYNNASILQACKLLDTLVTLGPDDFQLHEWLFITDTIDAVYKPADWTPTAIVDEVAESLGIMESSTAHMQHVAPTTGAEVLRRPYLDAILAGVGAEVDGDVMSMSKSDFTGRILRPFLGQLSIFAFESIYAMGDADLSACQDGLLRDLFEGGLA